MGRFDSSGEVLEGDGGLAAVELEGVTAAFGIGRVEAVQRPIARIRRLLLMGHGGLHVDAVGDAGIEPTTSSA